MLWIRSYFALDAVFAGAELKTYHLATHRGWWQFGRENFGRLDSSLRFVSERHGSLGQINGVGELPVKIQSPILRYAEWTAPSGERVDWAVSSPIWIVAAVECVLPLWWILLVVRRWKESSLKA
jgi:hypothetical protein